MYGGELHLGYVEFEVPVERTSGDEGSISDAQEGDMGILILLWSLEVITQGVRGKEHLDENSIKCRHVWDRLRSRRETEENDTIFLLPAAYWIAKFGTGQNRVESG